MDLFDAVSLTLWWSEGSKPRRNRWKGFVYSVEVTNTDSLVIKIFLKYLRERFIVQEHRIKVQLQIHEGDNKEELEEYWSKITNLPLEQFNKTIIRPVGLKIGKTKGTCKIRVHDKRLYLELFGQLEKLRGLVHQ